MLDVVETGSRVDKETYKERLPELRARFSVLPGCTRLSQAGFNQINELVQRVAWMHKIVT